MIERIVNMKIANARIGLLCIVALTLPVVLSSQPKPKEFQKSDSTAFPIEKYLNQFSMNKIEKTDAGYQYWFVDKNLADGKTLKMSVVKPHSATHPPHSHPEEEFFFVLQGKMEFYLNGQRRIVGPLTSLYVPPNVEHGIRNVGDTEAKYLVIKKYEK